MSIAYMGVGMNEEVAEPITTSFPMGLGRDWSRCWSCGCNISTETHTKFWPGHLSVEVFRPLCTAFRFEFYAKEPKVIGSPLFRTFPADHQAVLPRISAIIWILELDPSRCPRASIIFSLPDIALEHELQTGHHTTGRVIRKSATVIWHKLSLSDVAHGTLFYMGELATNRIDPPPVNQPPLSSGDPL